MLARSINFGSQAGIKVSRPSDALAATLLIGVLAGLYPAIRASRLHPTVALHAA
ncbi:hypothetical protein BX283_1026 [Streptomyces sp. TLI_146]|nr:hypothetical protein [Streptomyces sp. TLI_146]PKV83521.1 hypothetical protein BX283_1026 [Streptomyces sp. TLI_146]